MAPLDLTKILADFEGKWVVLSLDNTKVLHSGDSLDEIEEFTDEGIVMYVNVFDGAFSPSSMTTG
ncbi:MAG TPA: hypothetical protein VI932_01510 [Bacteroidota bacterium]|nr:hypothetical protein [Bacteroidota bacterium]